MCSKQSKLTNFFKGKTSNNIEGNLSAFYITNRMFKSLVFL